ncbi:MAG: M1 family metallopeptidase [Bergeyella sp.]|nr:M1 family metallopeptidase [Bergeyella sp.]
MKRVILIAVSVVLSLQNFYSQTETSGREPIYRAAATKKTELVHTRLKVSFGFDKEELYGEEWLTAKPFFYATDSLILDAKAMLIHEVAMEKYGKKKPLKYTYDSSGLKIGLDRVYSKDENYTVYIKYTARPNEIDKGEGGVMKENKGLYFINAQGKDPDKPTQIWTQGETESSSVWFPTIDKPNQKTTQEIYMTVPDKYVTLSNGLLKDQKKEAEGQRTDHWVMDKKHAPYLFFMGVGDFAVVKDKWKTIPVDYYVEKEYAPYAKEIFGNTPEMITFFSKRLGYEFPWQKYSQIVVRDFVSGAMENTTAVSHLDLAQQKKGDLIDENKWERVIAHELFHHWFGDLVTAESWSNLTVNESFANYSEYLWNDYKYGKDYADYYLIGDLERYLKSEQDFFKNLVRYDYKTRGEMFDVVSYNKGGGILHMLRNYLGDDAFFTGLTDYLKTHEYGTAEVDMLRISLEKVSGKDLNWFFNQWYFGSGHPRLSYSYSYDDAKKEVRVSIDQSQNLYFQFPLSIDLYIKGKPERKKVWIKAKPKNSFTFSAGRNPDFISINPDGVILSEIKENKTQAQYATQYLRSKDFYDRYRAIVALSKDTNKEEVAIKTLVKALRDPFFRIRIKAIKNLDLSNALVAGLATSEIEKLAENDEKTLVQAAAIMALTQTNNKKFSKIYERGINAVSNAVKYASIVGISQIDPNRASGLISKTDLSNVSEETMDILLPMIIRNRIEKQMPAIAKTVVLYPYIKFQDMKRGELAEEGYNWIMSSDSMEATEKAMSFLKTIKKEIGNNPQAKMAIVYVLRNGLAQKTKLLDENPSNASVKGQVDLINKTIELYK